VVTAEPTRVRVFGLELQERAMHIAAGRVTALASGPRNLIAYGDDTGRVHVWPVGTYGEVRSSPPLDPPQPVGAVTFARDGGLVAASSGDAVRLYTVAPSHLSDGPVIAGHDDRVTGIAISPDGQIVASSSQDATVRLWSRTTGAAIGAPLWAGGELRALAFSPDGRTLAAAQDDDTIRLWDVATRRPLGQPLAGAAEDLAFGRSLVAASAAAHVHHSGVLWAHRPDQLAGRICAIAGRELTEEEWRASMPDKDWRPTCRTR
jgi:WD40 repeat protein